VHVCLLAALFTIAAVITMLAIQRWGRTENRSIPEHQGSLDSIPGLTDGESVALPKLPSLENNYVDLSTQEQKYLLCAFISTECAGCSQDQPFWKNLRREIGEKGVGFYLISIDVDQAKVQSYAKAYEFADLPVLFDPQRQALTAFKIHFVPQYVLLTSSGRVIRRWNGVRRYDPNLQAATDKLDGLRERVYAPSPSVH
jgi:peroxiredoxin